MVKNADREELIEDNLRLVHHLCRRFAGRGIEYEDLFGAGCVGLVKAADAFDSGLGFQFSTYAVPVVLGEIRRLFRDGGSVKVSRGVKELSLKISRVKTELEYNLSREPTVCEIAGALGVSPEDVALAQNAAQPAISLTSVSDDGAADTDVPVAPDKNVDDRIVLDCAIEKLTPFEQSLVRMRYFEQLTQNETAARLCITQVAVSRAEKKILAKLRAIIGSVA